MPAYRQTTRLLTAALSLGVAAAAFAAPVRADDVPIDTKILRGILGDLGLKRPGENEIKYQERAPLVIPPDKDLPAPQSAGAAVANNPAWPKDPDIARAKLSNKEEEGYGSSEMIEHEQNPLRPGEMMPGAALARRTARTQSGPQGSYNDDDIGKLMSPKELGYKDSLWNTMFGKRDDSANARFTGEPARTSLTDPPPGYQTPSPNQPYGTGNNTWKPTADRSYETRSEAGPDQ